jgi:hypothetical protein
MTEGSQARKLALTCFQNAKYPDGLNGISAWLGIYQVLLWYEKIGLEGISYLPHIIDADKLRPPSYRSSKPGVSVWQQRALATDKYLAQTLNCQPEEVRGNVDLLMNNPVYRGVQRQNPLGIAFPALVCYILSTFGNSSVSYELEVPAQSVFPGIIVPGRSKNPRIDIVVRNQNHTKAVISCKWSLRHDRLNDISNECPAYKQAASWTRTNIEYYVITNEYDPARLNKLLSDSCVDALVHVHKYLPINVCGLNSRLVNMLDLVDLINKSKTW